MIRSLGAQIVMLDRDPSLGTSEFTCFSHRNPSQRQGAQRERWFFLRAFSYSFAHFSCSQQLVFSVCRSSGCLVNILSNAAHYS